jgi:hypothetical protein
MMKLCKEARVMAKRAAPWSKYDIVRPDYQDDWMVFGSGFLQCEGDSEQGVPSLAAECEERFKGVVRVEHRSWNADWDSLAEWILRRSSGTENLNILYGGYSWGGGFGFKQFAKACRRRGIRIRGTVLSDAVFHLGGGWCHRLGISQVAAFWPPRLPLIKKLQRPWIRLPDNIDKENFYWFNQKNSRLRGHQIYWKDTGELAKHNVVLPFRDHEAMDEAPEFREQLLDLAYKMFPGVQQAA